MVDHTDQENHSKQKTSKRHTLVLNYFEKIQQAEKAEADQADGPINPETTTRKRGRPKKAKEDKVQFVGLKLPPVYVQYLKNIPTKQGLGLKIRKIIDAYQILKQREKGHLRIIKEGLHNIDSVLKDIIQSSSREATLDITWKKLEKSVTQLKVILSLYQFTPQELSALLTKKEKETYEFTLSFDGNFLKGEDL